MTRVLDNRCALVTGANQGMGYAIAARFLEAGASVLVCARDARLLEEAALSLTRLAGPGQTVLAQRADVSKERDVQKLLERVQGEFPQLDILVNNAAVAGPAGRTESVDWDRWVRTIEINLLGSVLMCRAVLPLFKRTGRGKIIQLAGGGATSPMPGLSAYAASKAAVVRFAETLAEETRQDHIDVNALAPGMLKTRMLAELVAAGPERIGRQLYERAAQQQRDGGVPLGRGADLAVFLASAASDGITGKLLSALWDPWETLPEHLDGLNGSDVYTLRRIVPEDRALAWGARD